MSQDRADSGRYTDSVSLAGVRAVFAAVDGPVVTSADVAEQLDCSNETARRKLRRLEARGEIASRKTAGRVVWWRVDGEEASGIDASDPFWEFEPGASGEHDISETVDEVLYGDAASDA